MSNDHILGPGTIEWLGVAYRTILSTESTGGAMSIFETLSPAGSGPPRHIHHREDEAFVVLSGQCEFWIAGQSLVCGPGETAFVPRGTEHCFRILGDQPSRHVVILTPGGFEGFFAEMARGNFHIPENMAEVIETGRRYHLTFTGPPL